MTHSLNKSKIKILLLEGIHKNAIKNFKKQGYTNIIHYKKALDEKELLQEIKDTHIIGIRSRTKLNKKILENTPKLIAIGAFCIGTNQIDLDYAQKTGIPVFNAPYSNTRSVAELVIAEAVMLMRGIPQKNTNCHNGIWTKSADNSFEVRNKNIGIIGCGNIGSQVSILAQAMGMNVYYYDIENKLQLGNATPCNSLKALLNISDIVTIHVPGAKNTEYMINKKELNQMKKGSYLINAARGNVVNIKDLSNALESKHLLGAAIDVFPTEPASNKDEFQSELRKFDNVILTPHIGGSTQEAQTNIAKEVSDKLIKYSDNGSTTSSVNFANASLPILKDCKRFLHIHKNTPGMLEKINKIFAKRNINIDAQYLQTNGEFAYLVIDANTKKETKDIQKELSNLTNTIKTRILF